MELQNTLSHSVTRDAWDAVKSSDVGALDNALSRGANTESIHPLAGHNLLSQAVKSESKAAEMAAILIDRGAKVPHTQDPLAFELTWCAIMGDSPLLAKRLMDQSEEWKNYFSNECVKFVTSEPTKLNTYFKAVCAHEAIDRFNILIADSQVNSKTSQQNLPRHSL